MQAASQTRSRILIADDHPVVRLGLRHILSTTPDLMVAAEAEDGEQALSRARRERFDAVVLDIAMPGKSGLEVLRQLKTEHPELPVLVLSVHAEDQYAARVVQLGAAGYMVKHATPEELIDALRRVVSGHMYVSEDFAERLASEIKAPRKKHRHELLSVREYEVLVLLAAGRSPTQIADEMCLSIKTVSTYRARLLRKLGAQSTADIIHYAIREHIVD